MKASSLLKVVIVSLALCIGAIGEPPSKKTYAEIEALLGDMVQTDQELKKIAEEEKAALEPFKTRVQAILPSYRDLVGNLLSEIQFRPNLKANSIADYGQLIEDILIRDLNLTKIDPTMETNTITFFRLDKVSDGALQAVDFLMPLAGETSGPLDSEEDKVYDSAFWRSEQIRISISQPKDKPVTLSLATENTLLYQGIPHPGTQSRPFGATRIWKSGPVASYRAIIQIPFPELIKIEPEQINEQWVEQNMKPIQYYAKTASRRHTQMTIQGAQRRVLKAKYENYLSQLRIESRTAQP